MTCRELTLFVASSLAVHPSRVDLQTPSPGYVRIVVRWPWWRFWWSSSKRWSAVARLRQGLYESLPVCVDAEVELS